jgi:peptidoglycan/xylan/chitin deacetylase (PgdA/CDA1 family)
MYGIGFNTLFLAMRLCFFFFALFCAVASFAQRHQVCITIDDLPVVNYGNNDTLFYRGLTNRLLQKLSAASIPAIGFVNERKLHNNGTLSKFQVSLLSSWIDHGMELGNHTYSHPDYNNLSFKAFSEDIIRGEKVTRELLGGKGMKLTYIRHPFLHAGNSKAKSDSLNIFLKDRGYIIAPVTLDNDEYLFALAYHRTKMKNDQKLAEQIGQDYITYMEKKLKYYESQAQRLFGRNIKHVLLIHANLLNSDYIDALITMFTKNNYDFTSLGEALKDPAYQTEVTSFGNWGISWIDRWALSAGKKGDFFKDEPATPDYIQKLTAR